MRTVARELKARPLCAVCRRPVDSLIESEHFGRQRFTARCHGQVETVDVPPGVTVRDVSNGVAFAVLELQS